MASEAGKHEFHVAISGVELNDSQVERLNRAVQSAVLAELGHLGIQGDYGLRFPRPPILGIIFLPPEEFERQ